MNNDTPILWSGSNGISIPSNVNLASDIIKYADSESLTKKQQQQIIAAFQIEAYDMAAEYAWKKAMSKLKETIATLGSKFIGEMLGRSDIDEYTPVELVLTDYSSIQLAEQLGVIGKTAALKLKQAQELISHFFSNKADEEFSATDATSIIKSSVQYVLGEQEISIAIEFSQLRDRLLSENLPISDNQIDQLINSPLFYIRTVLTILLSSAKKDKGAKLEHALFNTIMLIPQIWKKLAETDKWNVGTTYRDVVADGNSIAANGLKRALLQVEGFDFVPENLRSSTFKDMARRVIETHYAYDNFYNEPSVVKALVNLGSTIPAPAFSDCIQALLAVYLGNRYGVSLKAALIAKQELVKISRNRWDYYFSNIIEKDEIILLHLQTQDQIIRFSGILKEMACDNLDNLPKRVQKLYNAIIANNKYAVNKISTELYDQISAN